MTSKPQQPARRRMLRAAAGSLMLPGAGLREVLAQNTPPHAVRPESAWPTLPCGVMSGDVTDRRAIIWSKTDRPARMIVEYATTQSMRDPRRIVGPAALESSAFTARLDLVDLPPGQTIFYRVTFQDLVDTKSLSEALTGQFVTPFERPRDIVFAFSGDEAGQGWGINESWGGYRVYEAMRRFHPDFFIHSGDQIYADGPIKPEVTLDDGSVWKNLVIDAKTQVAESIDDFRGNFAYNLLDVNKRRFAAEVPFLVQWDDHETRNNWYPGQQIGPQEKRYEVRSASLLAARARQAMFEFNPMRFDTADPERVYRVFRRGALLDVFMLDERSYRGPNSPNRQSELNAEAAFLGGEQLQWLKRALRASRATWKVIASDMPISIVVPDLNPDVPQGTYEAWANGDHGKPLGRELELADLLRFIKHQNIKNVVWVTADVHYASATRYDPGRAQFTDFKPFWEFVGGPINAGTFGPGEIDNTFGPDVKYISIPRDMKQNRSPAELLQFFGVARINAANRTMSVSLHGIDGQVLFKTELAPEA
jgi:alkaline phosphatase D